ncbi:MAG: hypothetical protein R6W69_02445 [Anaerolineales bacterium]
MTETNSSPTNENTGLVNAPEQDIDMEALAEKIIVLLRREIEIETERFGKLPPGR